MSSVLWLNRGPLSRGSQAKRVRHRGKTAKEKERDCTLEALGIDWRARMGTTSTQALRSDKERESISCQWARQRGTDWCFFLDCCCPHKLGRVTPNTGRMGGTGQASSSVHRSLPFGCELPRSPDPPPSLPLKSKVTTGSKSVEVQRSEQWPVDLQAGQRATGCIMADL